MKNRDEDIIFGMTLVIQIIAYIALFLDSFNSDIGFREAFQGVYLISFIFLFIFGFTNVITLVLFSRTKKADSPGYNALELLLISSPLIIFLLILVSFFGSGLLSRL